MNLKTLRKLSCGLYVVCSQKKGKLNGQIANTVSQITSEPPVIAVSINKRNLTHEFIQESKVFTVSTLSQNTPLSFIGKFGFKSGRQMDKLQGTNYKLGETKAPLVLDHTLAYLETEVTKQVDVGTHTIFVGELVGADFVREDEPMTFAYYYWIKRGPTPKTAPSYIEERKEAAVRMVKYECSVCGYIYEPELGDSDGGIKPGTPFEDLLDDWLCPVCGASKSKFEPEG